MYHNLIKIQKISSNNITIHTPKVSFKNFLYFPNQYINFSIHNYLPLLKLLYLNTEINQSALNHKTLIHPQPTSPLSNNLPPPLPSPPKSIPIPILKSTHQNKLHQTPPNPKIPNLKSNIQSIHTSHYTMIQDVVFDVIILGDAGVGKSCIMLRFSENRFLKEHNTTIGVEFGTGYHQIGNTKIKLNIWDTAGTENFRSITRTFYRRAKGVMLVYDVTAKHTFESLETWLKEVKQHCAEHVVVYLVGNQVDLVKLNSQERQVSTQDALEFVKKHNLTGFRETSATDGSGIYEAFDEFCNILIRRLGENRQPEPEVSPGIKVEKPSIQNNKKKCC